MASVDSIFEKYGVQRAAAPTTERSGVDSILEKYGVTRAENETQEDERNIFQSLTDLVSASARQQAAAGASLAAARSKNAEVEKMAERMRAQAQEEASGTLRPEYVLSKLGTGAAQTAQGVVNAVANYPQVLQKSAMAQAAGGAAQAAAFSKNEAVDALSEQRQKEAIESVNDPLKFHANFGDKAAERVAQKYGDVSKKEQLFGDVAEGLGGLAPSIIASLIPGVGVAMATAITSSSAAGNATKEAVEAGADNANAVLYGAAVGAVEIATEKMFDGLSGVFGKSYGQLARADGGIIENIIKSNVKNAGVQKALNGLVGALGEGAEEWISEYVTSFLNRQLVGADERTWKEVGKDARYSALIGALIGGLVQAGNAAANGAIPNAKQAADAVASEAEISRSEPLSSEPTTATSEEENPIRVTPGFATEGSVSVESGNSAMGNPNSLAYMLASNIDAVSDMAPVKSLSGTELNDRTKKPSEQIRELFAKIGNAVFRNGFGRVSFGEYGIDSMLNHKPLNRAKMVTVAAAPEVVQNGRIINDDPNWKGRGYRSITFAAPVEIAGTQVYVAAVVNQLPDNRFYLSECVDSNGNYVRITETPSGNTKSGVTVQDGVTVGPAEVSGGIIPQASAESNTENAQGMPDGMGAMSKDANIHRGKQVDTQSKATVENINLNEQQRRAVAPETHERITEAESLHRAQTGLYTDSEGNIVGYQESIDDLVDGDRILSGVESDRLQLLLKEAARRDDVANIKRIAKKLQQNSTFVAQALQANQKWISDDPATKLAKILTIADKWAQTHKTKKGGSLEVPDALIKEYTQAKTDAEREAVVEKIQTHIAQNTGATLMEKWNAIRYTNMLGNAKTQVRNLLGNAANRAMYSLENEVATLVELALPKSQRTKSAFVGSDWMKAAKADYANVQKAINRYGKYANESIESDFTAAIEDQRSILSDNGPLELYRKGTKWAMEKGDEIFSKGAYARALAGYLKAKGYDAVQLDAGAVDPAVLEAAREYAVKRAQETTFRDSNALSDTVSRMRFKDPKNAVEKAVNVIGEGVAPFRRTPANVLMRAYEYSPVGLIVDTALKVSQAKKGNATASDIIESLSKGLTGTALFVLGKFLADNGLLRATGDEEAEDVDALMNAQDYSLIIPGVGSYTLDWLTPASLLLFMGAELGEILSDGGFDTADLDSVIASFAEPLMNLSMLSGIDDALNNIKYSDSASIQLIATTALSYLTQGLTNTLTGQVERIAEPERMTTYVDKNNAMPDWLERSLGKASAKTPGWDYNQTQYLDEFGNIESNGGIGERIMENLFSPGYFSPGNEGRAAYDFAQEAFDTLGYNPAPAAYVDSKVGGETLTQAEKERYQKVRGQTAEDLLAAASNNKAYAALDDETKIAVLEDLKSQASDAAKVDVLGSKGIKVGQTATEKAIAALGAGDMVTYYAYWNNMEVPENYSTNPNWQKYQTILDMNLGEGATLGLIEAIEPDTYKKIKSAYDQGVPLSEIIDYYEAVSSKREDGEAKKSKDKKRAVRELEFSSSKNKAILNREF